MSIAFRNSVADTFWTSSAVKVSIYLSIDMYISDGRVGKSTKMTAHRGFGVHEEASRSFRTAGQSSLCNRTRGSVPW